MKPFDDMTPEEMQPENQRFIEEFQHFYGPCAPLTEAGREPMIARTRERLVHAQQLMAEEDVEIVSLDNGYIDEAAPIKRVRVILGEHGREKASRRSNVLSMVAAAVLVAAFISSSLLLFTHHAPNSTGSSRPTATAKATPQTGCHIDDKSGLLNFTDSSIAYICSHRLFQELHLSKRDGIYTVSIERAYADANGVILQYSVFKNGIDMLGTITPNIDLSILKGSPFASPSNEYESISSAEGNFVWFTFLENTAVKPQTLHLHLEIGNFSVNLDTYPASAGTPSALKNIKVHFTFDFPVPYHTELRVVEVHQTAMVGGRSLTLEKIKLTRMMAIFYLAYHPQDQDVWPRMSTFSIGNLTCTGVGNSDLNEIIVESFCLLYDQHGTWKIAVDANSSKIGESVGNWEFQFNVP